MHQPIIQKMFLSAALLLVPATLHAESVGVTPEEGVEAPDIARFGVACIKNATGNTINYDIKWGDGSWESYSVEGPSGSYRWHAWRYDEPGITTSPSLSIRFDSDMTEGTSYVEYSLDKYAAEEESCELGKTYQFEWDHGSSRYIDLVSLD